MSELDPHESGNNSEQWERGLLSRLSFAAIKEQRNARRWGIFFKLLTFGYLFLLAFLIMNKSIGSGAMYSGPHTALVDMEGVISTSSDAGADTIITGLRNAFKNKNTAGVILRINSPGGGAVQARYINHEIKRLRKKYPDIRLYAVITDMCASGGYYVAVAADKIYADASSIVGSIGVTIGAGVGGFGFTDAMEKMGIERRMMTAGNHKGLLDPFSPLNEAEVNNIQTMLDDTHAQFVAAVQEGRAGKLDETADLFNGFIWTGQRALKLGMIDGIGSSSYVAREIIGEEEIVDFTPKGDFLDQLSEKIGVVFANVFFDRFNAMGVRARID